MVKLALQMALTSKKGTLNHNTTAMQYMFEFNITQARDTHFTVTMPEQREVVNDLMFQGSILSYVMDLEKTRIWVTVKAVSEPAALAVLEQLPLIRYMRLRMHPVRMWRPSSFPLPEFSEN